jgi:hypothetical protein
LTGEAALAGGDAPPPGAEADASRARPAPGADPLVKVVFALLVLASFAAFAITQHLKHTPTAVQDFMMPGYFAPSKGGVHHTEHLSFRIAHDDLVTVAIVDSEGDVVATLLRNRPLARYTPLSLVWDGRRGPTTAPLPASGTPHDPLVPVDRGRLASTGEYRMRVSLSRQHRTVLSPKSFELR